MTGVQTCAFRSAAEFVIAWTSGGQDGSGSGVYAQRFQSDITPPLVSATFGLVNFTGNTLADAAGTVPPNTMGDVGAQHIVEFTNGVFAVYSKADGALVGAKISDTTFWTTKAGLSFSGGLTDPRILYDAASQRWFATELTKTSTGNLLLLARSDTSDPTGTWKGVSFTASSGFGDFDTLSLDADAVYIGTNNFDHAPPNSTLQGVSLFSIPKADLLASTPTLARMSKFEGLDPNQSGFTLQAATNYGPSTGHGTIIAMDRDSFQINRTNVLNPNGPGASLSATTGIVIPGYPTWLAAPHQINPTGRLSS